MFLFHSLLYKWLYYPATPTNRKSPLYRIFLEAIGEPLLHIRDL